MLQQAQKIPCSAHFTCQNACCLPYENRSFDLVLIGNALHIMDDPRKALGEIRRVLKPGGLLLAPTFVYEGKVNHLRMKITTLLGFRTVHKWKEQELISFVEGEKFRCISSELVPGDPLPVAFSVFRKV